MHELAGWGTPSQTEPEAELHMTATSVEAWPENALEIQPRKSSPPESQTPSHSEQSASVSADDKPDQPHAELQVPMLMIDAQIVSQWLTRSPTCTIRHFARHHFPD